MPLVRSTEFRSTCDHVALRQAGIGQKPTFEYLENVAPRCPEDARSRWMFDRDKVSEFVAVRDGTMNDIGQWLEQHGLGQYAEAFANNDIDFRALPTLTEEDLKELGLSLGHRRILQQAIAEFAERESTETETTDQAGEPVVPTGEAERRQLTIMFCDLVGSTALSESMDLEEYREVLTAYQAAVRKATEHYGGYIARYMGDGLLAYFGYPQAHEGDPERAVRAALTSVDAVSALDLVSPLEVRIGIATGPVVVGDIIGEGASEEAAVLGETPNVAARLQGVAGPNEVIISPSTERLLKNRVEVRRLAHMNLKGLSRPITPYQALRVRSMGEVSDASQKLLPLIGREVEVALLRRGWRTAQEGEGQVVILSGEAGVGKTHVVRSFQDEARGEIRNRVLWFCEPYYQTTANYPAIERIRRVLKLAEDDSTEKSLDKLESMLESLGLGVPELAPVLGFLLSISTETRYPPLAYSPEELRQRIISAQVDLLLAMAAQSPVLMVVEDVHWADPTTVEVLERFVEAIRAERILMILTSRPEFESPWVHHGHVTNHTLSRLNRHETVEMIKCVMRNKSLPRETMEQIVSRTDGVPLFVEEVTKALLSSAGEVGVPASLHDSLMARLDRLGPVKELAQTASVIGRSFPVELLATVSGRSMDEIETGLRTLREAGLAYPRRGHGHTIFDFKHALVRDAAYGSLLHSSRQTLHRRVAEQLAAGPQGQTEPELLATHYAEAGCLEDAAELWGIAGNRSVARSAFNEAVSHFSAGIDALSQLESTPLRCLRRCRSS